MSSTNCIKLSYKGLTRYIMCDVKLHFDELLNTVMDKFNIDKSHKLAIEFYDAQGHKFNKEMFEYFLLLFPNPQKIFFIRLDYSKIINLTGAETNIRSLLADERVAFGKSKLNNRQTNIEEADTYCEAVPVRRQNCFLGQIPGTTMTQQQAPTSTGAARNHSQNMAFEIGKRRRLLKQSSPRKKHLNNPTDFKRSLRM